MPQSTTMSRKQYQIFSVETEQFATFPLPETDSKRVQVTIGLDLKLNDEKRHIICTFDVSIRLLDEIIIKLRVKCSYSIQPEIWNIWIDAKSGEPDVPLDFVEHIGDLTMATARGILHTKTENTKYNTFMVPVMDFKDAITPN